MPNSDASAALLGLGEPAMPGVIECLHSSNTRAGATTFLIAAGRRAMEPLIEVVRRDENRARSSHWPRIAT